MQLSLFNALLFDREEPVIRRSQRVKPGSTARYSIDDGVTRNHPVHFLARRIGEMNAAAPRHVHESHDRTFESTFARHLALQSFPSEKPVHEIVSLLERRPLLHVRSILRDFEPAPESRLALSFSISGELNRRSCSAAFF
jgi:hypothetical protein